MGNRQGDHDPAGSPKASRLKAEVADSKGSHNPAADTSSPHAAKAPRVHSRDTLQNAALRTWVAQHAISHPERLRGHASAAASARSPPSQRSPKYYRMALVSAIQPSFGTDPASMDQGYGESGRVDATGQSEHEQKDEGDGRTSPRQGSGS